MEGCEECREEGALTAGAESGFRPEWGVGHPRRRTTEVEKGRVGCKGGGFGFALIQP